MYRTVKIFAAVVLTVAACVVVGISLGFHQNQAAEARNRARAQETASAEARDFAARVRVALAGEPLTHARLLEIGQAARVGMVHAVRAGSGVTVTFSAIVPYAVPGGVAMNEVDLCFAERFTRGGSGALDELAPLNCAQLPASSPADPAVTLPE